jgi:hypothetical protein
VLGTPPAFVLSQDQTLHEVFRNGLASGSDFVEELKLALKVNLSCNR